MFRNGTIEELGMFQVYKHININIISNLFLNVIYSEM